MFSVSRGKLLSRLFTHARGLSTSAQADPSKIRNIALLAHIDSGKTTLTESILHKSSYLSVPGTVDTGSTTTDFLPAERERGITIQSASIPVKWKQWNFNLVDTPGHVDFGMEVESASRVIDGAVVLMDSVEGVEGQTKGVWRQLDRHKVPTRLIFMNKLDRPGASLRSSILSALSHRLHPNPALLTLPVASFDPEGYAHAEPGIQGVVDLVKWEIWKFEDGESTRIQLPNSEEALKNTDILPENHPLLPHLLPARIALIDNLSNYSPDLLSSIMDLPAEPSPYLALPPSAIISSLRELTLKKEILPILCGSALRHVGTEILMDYVGALLANPLDVAESNLPVTASGVQLLAWKVMWDKRKGWMTFVRVYSGTLTRQCTLVNQNTGKKERVSKLLLLYASEPEEVETLPFGSVGVILGLKHTRTGDTLVSTNFAHGKDEIKSLPSIVPPPSVISASVLPQTQADVQPVQDALLALSRTDPSLRVVEDEEEGQTLVHGLGALHLEIVEGRLRDEWGVKCKFGKRRVSYREGFHGEPVQVAETWERDMGGKPVGAKVSLEIRPLEEGEERDEGWGGNMVVDSEGRPLPSPDSLGNYPQTSLIPPLVQGLRSALSVSPHTSLPLTHIHIMVRSHSVYAGSPPSVLSAASSHIFRNAIKDAGPGPVMEPYSKVKVDVGEESMGKVVKDLTEHGGEVLDLGADSGDEFAYEDEGLYIPPAWVTPASVGLASSSSVSGPGIKRSVHAIAPLSKLLDYSSRLRAVSGGMGSFEMSGAGFREVGEARKEEIMRELGRI
ncbi:hypothetical protein BOTBODRAFT_101128 [Botryobasidium botryosum FD-172 SS1]|uniref:Elongation factor 2 n=1 Tax=Botryobasidium botryosum (strain FD-172 SS1) TaxID=930990 RepID=A0A067NAA4_BOTB1|nr:hypothetical protein BOTBODRAFT_101128 [Botryobasidium botryosum FD-172 SS1]